MDERTFTCINYYKKAKILLDESINTEKFIFDEGLTHVWASLDALSGLRYQGIKKFQTTYQPLFVTWDKSSTFSNSLEKLIQLSPVENMRTTKKINLNDGQNLPEILNFSYAVRGNLHHGRKDLEDKTTGSQRNKELVKHSFLVTYEILEKVLQNENIIKY